MRGHFLDPQTSVFASQADVSDAHILRHLCVSRNVLTAAEGGEPVCVCVCVCVCMGGRVCV